MTPNLDVSRKPTDIYLLISDIFIFEQGIHLKIPFKINQLASSKKSSVGYHICHIPHIDFLTQNPFAHATALS
jgi:hypothetical protein